MSEETKVEEKPKCEHKGHYTGIGQSTFLTGFELIVITSAVCTECGEHFLNFSPVPVKAAPKPNDSAKAPSSKIITN